MIHTSLKRTLCTLALFSLASLSSASQVASQWYFGTWNCNIDGRSAQMVWKVVDNPQTSCDGNVCSTSSGVAIKGWFNDSGSRWVPLESPRTVGNDFRFTYTGDRTGWFLRYNPSSRSAVGNTVWQGKAYPLSCVKG